MWLLAAAMVQAEMTCMLCHPVERVQFEKSIHFREGLGCDSCHGGDPQALETARAHGRGYLGVPARIQIPRLCASCHSDPERMRPYNHPIDQFALYQISRHGQRLAKGDERVAVCTDCHGVHDILSTRDPQSRTYPRNVPETCGRCHADQKLMGLYGLSAEIVEEYRLSVHGKALLEEANENAPTCARCHGVHGAAPPGLGDVGRVCGQCHPSARDYFAESIHKPAMDSAGLPECASCHGNHAIGPAGNELAGKICEKCHESDSAAAGLGRKLLAVPVAASQEIHRARDMIDEAERVPLDVEDYRARLELARTNLTEAYPVMHSLDPEQVSALSATARSEAEDIQKEIYEKLSNIRSRRIGLLLFWFYILLTVAVLAGYRREKQEG